MARLMKGVVLPGNSTVEFREYPVPEPGPGQALLKMKASSICGSDIRAIYHKHHTEPGESYLGVIAGHEPCGQIVKAGPGLKKFKEGDRVIAYHIVGCGVCHECRKGYLISCTGEGKAAYGWQRDGGHAEYMLADERSLVHLPDELTYLDGALCACGFGTAYEALKLAGCSGRDQTLVVGLGPVGLAVLMLARAMGSTKLLGVDVTDERIELAKKLGLVDVAFKPSDGVLQQVRAETGGDGAEIAVDASGSAAGRLLAIQGARRWGRVAFVGEGGTVTFEPSRDIIHRQITIFGSWVCSVPNLEELVERLVRWKLHPDAIVTHTFPLEQAGEAYRLVAEGKAGKVAITWPD